MEIHAHVPKAGKTAAHWLLEGLFIVVSVALAFGAGEYCEYRANRELAARILESLRAEVEHNVAILEPLVPVHEKWAGALAKADASNGNQSGFDVFFATVPKLPAGTQSVFPILRRSAWDAALSGGGVRLLDYALVAALSEIYDLQEIAGGNVVRLAAGPFVSTETFDYANGAASVRMLRVNVANIYSSEVVLLDLYRKHLPAIRAAANADP